MEPPLSPSNDEIKIALSPDEVELLDAGLSDWGGPGASLSAATALLGFPTIAACKNELAEMRQRLRLGEGLSRLQWTRALLAAEIIFVSAVVGSREEWTVIHAGFDQEWFAVLMRLQRKVPVDRTLLLLGPDREPW